MITSLAVLILLNTAVLTQEGPHQMPLTVAELGDNVTMTCSVSADETGLFYWYKLNLGYMVQTVAAGTFDKISLKEQFDNSRFTLTTVGVQHLLAIRNVSKEDEGTYFCQAGSAYIMKMINGTMLAVNDHKHREWSVYVRQRPEATSVQQGDSVTLQCSLLFKNKENSVLCAGEHTVYWFTAGSGGFNPDIIYTHSISKHEPEERSCVYSLSKTIQNSSDAGTYYCAVVTCGKILFGEGTKVETRQQSDLVVIVLGVLLALCVIVIAILIFSRD
ncbi:signal-regulatory protein beta-2-like [Channa argus]|uniref:signal-regulatory protein beta-2-like n=1 Tax=Channa argus TaxID=215402 RepID=UPI0035206367